MKHSGTGIGKDCLVSKHGYDNAARAEETKAVSGVSTTSFEKENCKFETVRNIDARQISYRYVVMAVIALIFSALAGVLVNQKKG